VYSLFWAQECSVHPVKILSHSAPGILAPPGAGDYYQGVRLVLVPVPVAARSESLGLWPLACWDCRFESHRGHGGMFVVSVVCSQVEVTATGWSLVQSSPTDCGASLCMIQKPRDWGGPVPLGSCRAKNKKKSLFWETQRYFMAWYLVLTVVLLDVTRCHWVSKYLPTFRKMVVTSPLETRGH
jgi:hypothetical protein